MEFLGKAIAVTVAELTRSDDGAAVMAYEAYRSLARRNALTVLRPGKGLAHPALIDWNSLPMRFKEAWIDKYGDPNELRRAEQEELRMDTEAMAFFAGYQLADGTYLKSAHQSEYALNATVLNRLVEMAKDQKTTRSRCRMSSRINWEGIYNECEALRLQYGHTLPKNVARLRDKIREYQEKGYECLISGKLCNASAIKITPEAGKQIIALKRCRFPRRTNAQIFEEFNRIAVEKGWKPLKAISSLVQFLSRPEVEVMWKDVEAGEYAAKMKYSYRHSTLMPTRRDSVWYGDGTKLNLYYKVFDSKRGGWKLATTTVFEVIDAYSEAFIGYHISPVENFESMYEAYRMAVEFSGHLPYELVYDQQGGTKREDAQFFLKKIATLSRFTASGNAPSKTIEQVFGRFQQQVLSQKWYFTGQNITARSDRSRVDMATINANVQMLPTYEELVSTYIECRNQWNSMPHPKHKQPRIDLYLNSTNDATTVVTDALKKDIFMLRLAKPVTYTRGGIQVQWQNTKYEFTVQIEGGLPDPEFHRNNIGNKYVVVYDPHDFSTVRLCVEDTYGLRFVTEAKTKPLVARAAQDRSEEQTSFLRRVERQQKKERVRLILQRAAIDEEFKQSLYDHGLEAANIQGYTAEEFEMYAEEIYREELAQSEALPDNASHIYPDSIGQMQKEISNATRDKASYWDVV